MTINRSNSMTVKTLFGCVTMFAMAVSSTVCGQKISSEQLKFFESNIRPVLVRECYSCHSEQAGQRKGGLRLDTKGRMETGGESGPAIVAGNLAESLLWSAINYVDFQMPPKKKLPDRVIADFREWIEMGAPDPRISKTNAIQSTVTAADIKNGRKFWSFTKPKRPPLPKIENENWARNPIDHFVYEKLKLEGLKPSDDANSDSLLRRISFDLIGLPPNPEQIDWFEQRWAQDPDAAIKHVVDRMLASPRFGERWGRHWLDVARYAESTGRELNATFPNAWRYRDYVIDAFNDDKPYDEFIQEQIAGDLLPARTDEDWAEHLIATGFLAVGPKSLTERNARQFNLDLVDEQIDVTTRVVLGVSVACARCHDHKFDPIQQRDYYAMAGIFESTSTHYGTVDSNRNRRASNQVILPISDPNPFDESLSKNTLVELTNQIAESREQLSELQRARREAQRSGKPPQNASVAQINRVIARIATLEAKNNSVDDSGKPLSFCMAVQEKDRPINARLLDRGEFDQPAEVVERGFVQVLNPRKTKIRSNSSGRLELAKWMTHKNNPLTARVMVNRVWQHMFGNGIVRTPENFGATGQFPTHPELLDYLAVEFVNNDWSVKELIRQIASSRTYRMSSEFVAEPFEQDPENNFLWRANPVQLDAESLRDAILFVSGSIDTNRPRGSVVAHAGSTVVRDGQLPGFQVNRESDSMYSMDRRPGGAMSRARSPRNIKIYNVDTQQNFRSVYLPIVRENLPRAMEVFDFAEPGLVVGKRETSNTPEQGLYLLNNEFVMKQSEIFAKRLIDEAESTTDRIRLAFQLSFGRQPYAGEMQAAQEFFDEFETVRESRRRGKPVELQKLSALSHAILASAEFRYIN